MLVFTDYEIIFRYHLKSASLTFLSDDDFMVLLKRESLYLLEARTEAFTGEMCMESALKHNKEKK